MEKMSLKNELSGNSYPGRGIIIGKSADGKHAITAYFIMGRSENSRNRVFVEDGEGIRTQAFDPSKLTDPSLIIYAPVRVLGNKTIVTNGDQTDTIYELMDKQQTFEQALRTREFEPDAPNYTPRISGVLHVENKKYSYANLCSDCITAPEDDTIFLVEYCVLFGGAAIGVAAGTGFPLARGAGIKCMESRSVPVTPGGFSYLTNNSL